MGAMSQPSLPREYSNFWNAIIWLVVTYVATFASSQNSSCLVTRYIPSNGTSYFLRNPNYPNNFEPGFNCRWNFYTDAGYNLNLNCFDVYLDRNDAAGSCSDYFSVYGTYKDGKYCETFSVVSRKTVIVLFINSTSWSGTGAFSCQLQAMEGCDCGWSYRVRITGGENTLVNEFPYMAALIDASKRAQICGATIISQRYVVTAAHCLDALNVRVTGVLVGEHDINTGSESNATRLYRAKRFIVHPSWTPRTAKNDIALVEVEQPMAFSSRVAAVCLPFNRPDIPSIGEALTVLGWGTTSFGGLKSDVLQKTSTLEVNMERCKETYDDQSSPSSDIQICTHEKGHDACQMDSGGPLLSANQRTSRYFLAGLVSYGKYCGGDEPAVNTRIYPYLKWIRNITQEKFCKK